MYINHATEFVADNRTTPIELNRIKLFLLKHADDVVLFLVNPEELKISFDRFAEFAGRSFLTINVAKCFSMTTRSSQKRKVILCVNINGTKPEQVDEFRNLGFHINETLNLNKAGAKTIQATKRALFRCEQMVRYLLTGCPYKVAEFFLQAIVV